MRKMLLAAMLAGAAAPALAAPDQRFDQGDQPRSERAERPERAERAPPRAERSQPRAKRAQPRAERAQPRALRRATSEVRVEPDRQEQAPAAHVERRQPRLQLVERTLDSARAPVAVERQLARPDRVRGDPAPALRVQREAIQGDSVRNWRARERQRADSPTSIEERNLRRAPGSGRSGEGLVEQIRDLPPVFDRNRPRVISTRPSPGAEPPEPPSARVAHARPSRHWRSDWRRDHRYDWRNHRHRNRSLFRLGFYIDPFGWGYHRYGIGWRLWPSHYSNRFWLTDPWSYRLPRSYGPYRWIRYWDDALLVNLYTGEVVDVVHNVFW